jgi:hypothetical protein
MALVFEDSVMINRPQFIAKVKDVSSKLGIEPDWLMAVMWSESKLNPSIKNEINCVGLIQFCPDTSRGAYKTIGKEQVLIDGLATMSNVQQLDYVLKLYHPYRNKLTRFIDLYLFNFYPYALGKGDDYVFGSEKGEKQVKKIASQNPAFDVDKDGKITIANFKQYIANKFKDYPHLLGGTKGEKPLVEQEVSGAVKVEKYAKRNWLLLSVILILIGLSIIFLYKYYSKKKK